MFGGWVDVQVGRVMVGQFSIRYSLFAVAMLALAACAPQYSSTYTSATDPYVEINQASAKGTWSRACDDTGDGLTSTLIDLELDPEGVSHMKYIAFIDSECKGTEVARVDIEFTFKLGSTVSKPLGAYAFDLTIRKVMMTSTSPTMSAYYSNTDFCGVDTWDVNVAHDVTGKKCGPVQYPAAGQMQYSIFKLSTPESLQVGKIGSGNAGFSSDTRMDVLDDLPYTKQ